MQATLRILMSLAIVLLAFPAVVSADHPDDGLGDPPEALHRGDPSAPLLARDAATSDVVSSGPFADVIKNLAASGRGVRLAPNATTDVWAHAGYAYIGTFNTPCGDGTGANGSGVRIFDVHNHNNVTPAGLIPSVADSRINDVKVARLNSGDVLAHSNEACAGGPGGIELYDVDDPAAPVHLASIRADELNPISDLLFGGIADVGVHNLWLFTQGARDYVAINAESAFDNFRVYEITVPTTPTLVGTWGAEEAFDPGVGDLTDASDPVQFDRVLDAALWLTSGFGSSANRFLHDITVSTDGTRAYLSNWDAGLVLLDLSDPASPTLVGIADPTAGPGGEGNSHAAWPSADGSIVVETTEDFAFGQLGIAVTSGPLTGTQLGGTEDVDGAPPPRFSDTGPVSGELVYVGRLCIGDAVENAAAIDPGDILVVRRGLCAFSEKILNAQALGAGAVVIANNAPGGPAIPNWTAPDPAITIPALFISTADGDLIQGSPTGNTGTIDADTLVNLSPWGFVRIWDFSMPSAPVLLSTFNTVNSLNASGPPDPRGTYSVHNVVVEGDRAYLSWYSDGVLILDISDPANPVEVARCHREGPAFEAENGGIQDVWGIYKIADSPWIYAADRNGGLYVLKEYGSGSAKGQP